MCHVDTGPVVHDSVPAACANQGETDIPTVHDNGTHNMCMAHKLFQQAYPKLWHIFVQHN